MNAYIDISYIFHLLLCLSSIKLMKIISNIKTNKKELFILEVSSLVLYINVLIYDNKSIIISAFYYIFLFYIIYKSKFIIAFGTYIFVYYSLISIIRIFTSGIYIYRGVMMIHDPNSFIYIFMCPMILIIIEIITRSIKSLMFLKKYRYDVKVVLTNKSYLIKGYFDSGNTLKYKDLPVIFLINELKDKNIKYEKLLIEGIGKQNSEYLKGKILFNNKEKDVYCAYVNKKSFNGCECLLNVYLLG